ncbi:MAG: hypothetical protein AAF333_00725 [Planctomycetota bacterium]
MLLLAGSLIVPVAGYLMWLGFEMFGQAVVDLMQIGDAGTGV